MASNYRKLVVWQLAHTLRRDTLLLLRTRPFTQDWEFRQEGRKTASQICRPIPEGFRRKSHADFAKFLQYSLGSVGELRDFFEEAEQRGYATPATLSPLRRLCFRLERALIRFIHYLRTNDPPPGWW